MLQILRKIQYIVDEINTNNKILDVIDNCVLVGGALAKLIIQNIFVLLEFIQKKFVRAL